MYYDAHTHLNDDKLYPHWQTMLDTFVAQGGISLVVIGIDHPHNYRAIEIAQQAKTAKVYATIGVHPSEVAFGNITNEEHIRQQIGQLKELYQHYADHIVAIGECGVDAHYSGYEETKTLQWKLLEQQCFLASELDLPIVIHSRDQFDDTIAILQQFPSLKVYLHCRGYKPAQIRTAVQQIPHIRIGRCGNITYPKAQSLRDSLSTYRDLMQGEHLLIETDAPYLTPQQVRGTTNSPDKIIYTYETIATLLDCDLKHLQSTVQESFEQLYLS